MPKHEKTTTPITTSYRPSRAESESVIRMLAEHYPKCFFEEPRRRLPLKKNITTDIIKDGDFDVSPEMIEAAVGWYESHVGYDYAMSIAGSKPIDLDGCPFGTVTKQKR
jgi:sRNA-binding protein